MEIDDGIIYKAFKIIDDFVRSLSTAYGNRHKPLLLYNRLISKTKAVHDVSIRRHVSAWQKFCVENREAIREKVATKICTKKVEYSERIYIDIDLLLHIADQENKEVIWKYLLLISALLDPEGRAKETLRSLFQNRDQSNNQIANGSGDDSSKEVNFLTNIMEKVSKNVKIDDNTNPAEALNSVMKSGILTDIMSDIQKTVQNGQLDPSKIFGIAQGLMGQMSNPENKDGNQMPDMMNMFSTMMSSMMNGATNLPPKDPNKTI
jgi:hypothetical protein